MKNILHKRAVPLFGALLMFTNSQEALGRYYRRLGLDPVECEEFLGLGLCTALESSHGHFIVIIGVFDGSHRTLVHEACHAAFKVCNYVGVPTDNQDANETFCYLVDWIYSVTEELLDEAD